MGKVAYSCKSVDKADKVDVVELRKNIRPN